MSTSATVHWEWFEQWEHAIRTYFPKFSKNNIVQAFFGVAVPYLLPAFINPIGNHGKKFTVINNSTLLFHPREWRGTNASHADVPIIEKFAHNYLTIEQMAAEINGYKKGSVGHLYLTSDGGFTAQNLYDMVELLQDHVKVVNFNTLIAMAKESYSQGLDGQTLDESTLDSIIKDKLNLIQ